MIQITPEDKERYKRIDQLLIRLKQCYKDDGPFASSEFWTIIGELMGLCSSQSQDSSTVSNTLRTQVG